jgi:hypothetical protein
MTNNKREAIINNLHTFYIFIKHNYVLKNKSIEKISLSELRNNYISELNKDSKRMNNGKPPIYKKHDINVSNTQISKLLKEIGFIQKVNIFQSTGNKTFVKMDLEQLRSIYEKRGFLHELDIDDMEDIKDEELEEKKIENEDRILNNEPLLEKEEQPEPAILKAFSELSQQELSQNNKQRFNYLMQELEKMEQVKLRQNNKTKPIDIPQRDLPQRGLSPKQKKQVDKYIVSFSDEILDMLDIDQ